MTDDPIVQVPLSWINDPVLLAKIGIRETINGNIATTERLDAMSNDFDDLRAEVQEDIRDDAARDARIAELEAANGTLQTAAQEAIDRANLSEAEKAELQQKYDEAVAAVQDAVAQLRSSDYPNAPDPEPEPDPEPVDDGGETPPAARGRKR